MLADCSEEPKEEKFTNAHINPKSSEAAASAFMRGIFDQIICLNLTISAP